MGYGQVGPDLSCQWLRRQTGPSHSSQQLQYGHNWAWLQVGGGLAKILQLLSCIGAACKRASRRNLHLSVGEAGCIYFKKINQ